VAGCPWAMQTLGEKPTRFGWRWIWVRVWVKERAAGASKERGGGVRLDAEQDRP
jgi:hypothetical protein